MSNMDIVFDQAYKLFEEKSFDSALETIENAEQQMNMEMLESEIQKDELDALRASISNFKGYNYLGMGDLETAKALFEEALRLNPNSSQACAGLGEVFYLCGMDQEAKILFEWAVDMNPGNRVAEAGLLKVNKNLGLPEFHYTLNIDLTINKKAKFYNQVANAYSYFTDGKYDEALRSLKTLDDTYNPLYASKDSVQKSATLENFKGFNYLAMNNLDDAKKAFERALNLNPNSSQACSGLGEIFFLQEKDKEAKAMFEWGVKNNPNNQFAVSGLAKVNKNLGFEMRHNYLDEKEN